VELSADTNTNNGSWYLIAPASAAGNNYSIASKGTLAFAANATGLTAPITNVLTGLGDISGDTVAIRVNGVLAATNVADQGTSNYGNYPLYIGRRGGTSLPYSGRLYSLIIRGAATTADQIARTEAWVNNITKAY
jgi:hypothetical protein